MAFFYNTIRGFFFQLDSVIFGLIDDVYILLLKICRTSIFSSEFISEFSERIFAIAGIFMLFKVTMSLIHYVINPDDFSDKNKGFSTIAKRIVLSLALLVLVPYAFKEAYTLQTIILEENALMHLVFGTPKKDMLPNDNYVEEAGRDIQFTLMSAFLQPNVAEFYGHSNFDLSACEVLYDIADNGIIKHREGSNYIYALNEACFGKYEGGIYDCDNSPLCQAFESWDNHQLDLYQTYAQAIAQQNYSLLMRKDLVIATVDDMYIIDYRLLLSTAVGIAIIYLFILFCIDIAVRSVKLGFLEMISPIPILSYIDPKSGDKGMLKKWFDLCWKSYLSLFMRLFALYLGVYAITIIGGYTDFITGEAIQGNWLLNVFMIVGILMFVKQLPKIIEDILGIKLDGKFTLNPFKKIADEAFGGKQLLGAGAAGLAGGAAFGTNLLFSRGKNPFRHLGSAIAGGFSAAGRGLAGAAKGEKFGKNFTNSYGAAMEAKLSRNDRLDDGVGWLEMQTAKFQHATGAHTRGERAKSVTEGIDSFQKAYDTIKNAAVGSDSASWTSSSGKTYNGAKEIQKLIDAMGRAPSADSFDLSTTAGQAAYQTALRNYNAQKKELDDAMEERIGELARTGNGITVNDGAGGRNGGAAAQAAIDDAVATMSRLQGEINRNGKSIDRDFAGIEADATRDVVGAYKQSKGAKTQFAGSQEYAHSQDVERYSKKKGQK